MFINVHIIFYKIIAPVCHCNISLLQHYSNMVTNTIIFSKHKSIVTYTDTHMFIGEITKEWNSRKFCQPDYKDRELLEQL